MHSDLLCETGRGTPYSPELGRFQKNQSQKADWSTISAIISSSSLLSKDAAAVSTTRIHS